MIAQVLLTFVMSKRENDLSKINRVKKGLLLNKPSKFTPF